MVKGFSAGFRYGCGLWAARLVITMLALPAAACLFAVVTAVVEMVFRACGWID